jgi:hypothetical protein
VDVNAKDIHNWTPLHWAVEKGYLKATEILLSVGADVNTKGKDGKTPFCYGNLEDKDSSYWLKLDTRNHLESVNLILQREAEEKQAKNTEKTTDMNTKTLI